MQQVLKGYLRKNPLAYDATKKVMRAIQTVAGGLPTEYRFFRAISKFMPELTFIQVGASDGMMNDPIREFVVSGRWRGLLVEPVPHSYKQLVHNYSHVRGGRLKLLNRAVVSNEETNINLYTFSREFLLTK